MMRRPIQKIPYTKGEEIFSSVVHITGGGLGIIGTAILIVLSAIRGDVLATVTCAIYGATMIILYTMSSLYHMLTHDKAKKFFRIMDHATIFLLIAGTYTPYSLLAVRGVAGLVLLCVIWGFAVLGIIFNSIDMERYKVPSMICYVAMGWAAIFTMKPLVEHLSTFALTFLILGGVFYTAGIFFFAKKIKYFHSVWHIFVLLGSVLHYFSILDIILSNK